MIYLQRTVVWHRISILFKDFTIYIFNCMSSICYPWPFFLGNKQPISNFVVTPKLYELRLTANIINNYLVCCIGMLLHPHLVSLVQYLMEISVSIILSLLGFWWWCVSMSILIAALFMICQIFSAFWFRMTMPPQCWEIFTYKKQSVIREHDYKLKTSHRVIKVCIVWYY